MKMATSAMIIVVMAMWILKKEMLLLVHLGYLIQSMVIMVNLSNPHLKIYTWYIFILLLQIRTVGLAKTKRGKEQQHQEIKEEKHDFLEEDVVEDLILSSDDDELLSSSASEDETVDDDDEEVEVKMKKKRHRPPTKKKNSNKNLKRVKSNE